ncbi:MAG: hypothetical protein H8E37_13380 [Planctomycetes bacterium]|nr:hypothetical protein [Planctomycetota bacterium]
MTGRPSDERLSAWLDNELTVEERAEFEKELNANPDLRQELEELQQLSALVKSAVPAKAPDELRGAIMRAVERESLMPAGNEEAAPTSSRSLLMAVAGIAVALVVAVIVINGGGENDIADNDPDLDQPILSMERGEGPKPANRLDTGEESVQVDGSLSILKKDLNDARVGDIIEGVGSDGVSIIRLTVVDRSESSIEALQLLLARESLSLDESGKPAEGEDGLVAVYVESSPEELTKALARLRDSFEFNQMDVSSLAYSDLEEETKDDLKLEKSGQRTVVLKPGTRLAKLAENPAGIRKATTVNTAEGTPPVRVIFVVVDEPAKEAKPKPEASGASAA